MQDWEPVVIRKKQASGASMNSESAVNAVSAEAAVVMNDTDLWNTLIVVFACGQARRGGATVDTVKKCEDCQDMH